MNCILAKMGKKYPVLESAVYADGCTTKVTASLILDSNHVDLGNPQYIETKWKKLVPALESIGVTHNAETDESAINVTMSINGKHNSMEDLETMEKMARCMAYLAKDRLSEPTVIGAIGKDCKPWFEDEEGKHADA